MRFKPDMALFTKCTITFDNGNSKTIEAMGDNDEAFFKMVNSCNVVMKEALLMDNPHSNTRFVTSDFTGAIGETGYSVAFTSKIDSTY